MVRAHQFLNESTDAVNELDLYIRDNEDIYRKQFLPLIHTLNVLRKSKKYNNESAVKKWQSLVDSAAQDWIKENGMPHEDVINLFPKESREKLAQALADRELKNMEAGEYDVVKGII
jgi:hypothetical protein